MQRGWSPTDLASPLPQITGCHSVGHTVSVLICGSNKLVLEEAERSIHDALCVIRCLVKNKWVAGVGVGGALHIVGGVGLLVMTPNDSLNLQLVRSTQ